MFEKSLIFASGANYVLFKNDIRNELATLAITRIFSVRARFVARINVWKSLKANTMDQNNLILSLKSMVEEFGKSQLVKIVSVSGLR